MKRITVIDSIKFVLIFLVIVGHTLECNTNNWINNHAYTFIYSFHMPAFIMISGYFSPKRLSRRKLLSIIIPYFIFQILYFGDPLRTIHNQSVLTFDGLERNIIYFYKPASVLWYIMSLSFWRIMIAVIPEKIKNHYILLLSISFTLSVFAGFIPLGRELSFQRTFAFFPYFIIGFYMNRISWLAEVRKISRLYGYGIILLYVITIICIPHIPLSMLEQFHNYYEIGNSMWQVMIMRIISYIWMIPLSLAVINIIPDIKIMAEEGKSTLFYYIYHVYLVGFLEFIVLRYNLSTSLLAIILYAVCITFILSYLKKIKILRILCNPIK